METAGLRRHFGTHSKAMNNDEANGCARSVHFINFIIQPTEYHLLYLRIAMQVGPPPKNQALTFICGCFSFYSTELIRNFDFPIPVFPIFLATSSSASLRLSGFLQRIHIRTGLGFGNAHKIVGSPATADNFHFKSK